MRMKLKTRNEQIKMKFKFAVENAIVVTLQTHLVGGIHRHCGGKEWEREEESYNSNFQVKAL